MRLVGVLMLLLGSSILAPAAAQAPAGITWIDHWEPAAKAAKAKKGAFVLVYVRRLAPASPACDALERGLLADPTLLAALEPHIACRMTAGTKDPSPGIEAFIRRYRVKICGVPSLYVLTADGACVSPPGMETASECVAALQAAPAEDARFQESRRGSEAEIAAGGEGAGFTAEVLAGSFRSRCEPAQTARLLRRVLTKQDDPEQRATLAEALGESSDFKAAFVEWDRAIAKAPAIEPATNWRIMRAHLRLESGDLDATIADLTDALAKAKAAGSAPAEETARMIGAGMLYDEARWLRKEQRDAEALKILDRLLAEPAFAPAKPFALARKLADEIRAGAGK